MQSLLASLLLLSLLALRLETCAPNLPMMNWGGATVNGDQKVEEKEEEATLAPATEGETDDVAVQGRSPLARASKTAVAEQMDKELERALEAQLKGVQERRMQRAKHVTVHRDGNTVERIEEGELPSVAIDGTRTVKKFRKVHRETIRNN